MSSLCHLNLAFSDPDNGRTLRHCENRAGMSPYLGETLAEGEGQGADGELERVVNHTHRPLVTIT